MSTTELIINTYEELKTFRDSVNNGTNSYQTVKLGADIDMNGDDWTPIGFNNGNGTIKTFSGTFNGQGHIISNMKINIADTDNRYIGLFGYTTCYIKNLILDNPIIYNSSDNVRSDTILYVSFLCGYNNQTTNAITNCRIINGHININNTGKCITNVLIGCICSFSVYKTTEFNITDCYVEVELNIKGNILPDFGGIARNNGFLNKCGVKITGIIDLNLKKYTKSIIINGLTSLSSTSSLQLKNCYVHMNFKFNIYGRTLSTGYNQLICGIGYNTYSSTPQISNCYVISNIELNTSSPGATYYYVSSNTVTTTNCYSLVNLLLRQYGQANNTYLNNKSETLKYNVNFADDTQNKGAITYKNTYTNSATLEDDLQSGKICYSLNGDQSEINFYQSLNFDKYPVLDNRHYIVNNPSTDTYINTSNTNYIYDIWTYDDLMQLKASVNTKGKIAYENKTVNLHRDFDLNNEKWTPILWFYGTLNGNGHKITNFYMDLADVYYVSDTNSAWGLSFIAAAKVNNFSIETTITGTYPKTTQLYLAALAYKGSCENVNVFVTYEECEISITGLYDFYWGGVCALNISDSDNSFNNCKLNMYLRNCNITFDSGANFRSIYIYGLCYDCVANNSTVLLSIDNTNTITNEMNTMISGIAYVGTITQCNSYLNYYNTIPRISLGGILCVTEDNCTVTSCYSFTSVYGSVNKYCNIGGIIATGSSKIITSYCVFNCEMKSINSDCSIGGLTGSRFKGSSDYIQNCYVDINIVYYASTTTDIYIGVIAPTNTVSNTAFYTGYIFYRTNKANEYITGTNIEYSLFTSGGVCYKLNDAIKSTVFYQSIGSNIYPTFNSNEWEVLYDSSKTTPYYNNIPSFNNTISSYADLIIFRNLVNSGTTFESQTITLSSDIDMKGDEWIPIGNTTNTFKGTFKGNNHTIFNFRIYCDNNHPYCGLFGTILYPGSINDLNIDNILIELRNAMFGNTQYYCGSLCGYANFESSSNKITNFINCHTNNCRILMLYRYLGGNSNIGGLIGNSPFDTVNIDNCSVKNTILDACDYYIICGLISTYSSLTISNSYCNVNINYQQTDSDLDANIFGFTGYANVTNCYSINTIKIKNLYSGFICGFGHAYNGSINNCYAITNIDVEINNTTNDVYINGFVRYNNNVINCYVNPNITYKITKKTGTINIGNFSGYSSNKTNNYVVDNSITNMGSIAATNIYYGSSYYNLLNAYQFRNGYVCNNLNNNTLSPFYQTLYSDPYPVLDNTHQPVRNYNNNYYNTLYVLSSRDNILFFYQILDSGYTYENEIVEVSRNFDCSNYKITPSTNAFKGTLEGNNYSIGMFTLFANETANSGFIALNQGTIQNLRLNNVSILDNGVLNSGRYIGFISGSSSGLITNCHVTNGYINLQYISSTSHIGGICGWYNDGSSVNPISKCSTNIKVNNIKTSSTGTIRVGGIIGNNGNNNINRDELSISYCCSIIDYNLKISIDSAYYYVGGISSIANNINNSYSAVNFNVQSTGQNSNIFLGGIFGTNISKNVTSMSNVYTNTTITYSRSYSSGVFYIGNVACFNTSSYKSKVYDTNNKVTKLGSYEYSTAFITDTYYTPIIKHDFSDGTVCYGLNIGTLNNPVFYQRINLDEYPLLFGTDSVVSKKGDIYASRIIGITNYQELKNIATLTNSGSYTYSQVQLLNDIDMNNYVNGETWTPIGTSTYKFTASFNGNNHTIYNMIINAANQEVSGFIGYSSSSIRDLNIDNSCKIISLSTSTITTNQCIGLLCGSMGTNSDIYSCNVKGYIDIKNFSGELRIGGISYYSSRGSCFNCNVEPIITVESNYDAFIQIGGIIQVSAYTIRYCNIHPSINIINNVSNRKQNINIGGVVCNNNTSNNSIVETFCDTHINIIDPYYTSSSKYYNLNTILNYTTNRKAYIYSPGNLISINNQLFIESEANKKYTDISIDQIKNGYLCNNILNDTADKKWYQNLREDYYPTLDSTHQKVTKIIDNQVYINPKYNINTFEDFINFRNEINGITSSVTYSCDFYLNCDINLNNIDWIPINYNNYVKFTGTFYGNNHTISKLSLNHSTYQWTGLFGFCNGLKFKDLIISDSTISITPKLRNTMCGASFIGYKITTIDNCHVVDSYINVLNGFNTGYNNEYYAGLGIGASGYQSYVINCTNCSVSLTYDITDSTTKTSTKNIVISGLISNTVNSTGTSVASSYVENYFTNCKADITFNKFYLNQLRCSCSGICCWMQYVRIENCNSTMNTKNNAIQLINDDTSVTFTIELNFAGILANLYNINRYNIQINKCYSYMDIDYSCYNSYLCGIAITSDNNGPTQTEAITNCYSNMNVELTNSIKHNTRICGIAQFSNISNCYSKLSCYFNKCTQSNSVNIDIGGISRYYNSTYGVITNCYSYLNVYGSITDSTAKVTLYISGGASMGYTSSKPYIYSIPYTNAEINSSLSGTYTLHNYCTTDYVTAITKDDFTNGKVCYGLNGDQSNINFYQYLKESNYPTLDSNYPKVLLKNSSYINQETITEINSKYDLFLFRDSVNAGNNYVDTTININVDIDLENMEWTPINNDNFRGTIRGNNHTISRFKFYNQQYCGFFGRLNNCKVFNLNFDDIELQFTQKLVTNSYYGIICADKFNSIISGCNVTNYKFNVTFNNPTTNSTPYDVYIGGLIGRTDCTLIDYNDDIINCSISKSSIIVTFESNYIQCFIGGLISNNQENQNVSPTIEKSYSNINITVNNKDKVNLYAVGINGFCGSNFQTRQCYSINSIKMINAYNCDISGFATSNCDPIRSWCISRIQADINPMPYAGSVLINGFIKSASSLASANDLKTCYFDTLINYNMSISNTLTTDYVKIGKISVNITDDVSLIKFVDNQIISTGTTTATIIEPTTYNTIRREDFSNGKVCYGLNNGGTYFYQIIGMDAYPVLTNNNSTIKQLTISMHPSPLNEFYYNNDFDGNICSYYDLCLFRNLVNSGTNFQGQTINLLCDIDMNGDEWIPIGVNGFPFRGSFNGNNHVIKNMVLRLNLSLGTTNIERYIGLFGVVGSTDQSTDILIRDIIIDKSCQMKYDSYSGVIYSSYVVGYFNKGTIDNCKVYADVNLNNNITSIYYASFAGFIRDDNCIISNCYANNNVVINNSKTIFIYGIAFMFNNSNEKTSKLINNGCIMNVRVTHKSSSTIQFYSLYVNGLSYGSLPNDSNVSTINPDNCNNNYCLMNTTILNEVNVFSTLKIYYSIDKLNSNNYVNNDYPFIKNSTKAQISLGSYDSEDFKSGKICYLLNGNQSNIKFYQNLEINKDIAPIPDNSHQQVYKSTTDGIDTYYNRPLNELPTQQLAVTTYNLANQSTPLYNYDPYVNRSSTNLYLDKINFALSTKNSFYSVTQPLEKYFYDIYHSSKKYKIHTNNIIRLNFHLFNQLIQSKITIGDVIMYNEIFAKLINNLPLELIKTELNYYKRLCFYLRDKNALDTEHYNLIFGDN